MSTVVIYPDLCNEQSTGAGRRGRGGGGEQLGVGAPLHEACATGAPPGLMGDKKVDSRTDSDTEDRGNLPGALAPGRGEQPCEVARFRSPAVCGADEGQGGGVSRRPQEDRRSPTVPERRRGVASSCGDHPAQGRFLPPIQAQTCTASETCTPWNKSGGVQFVLRQQ